MDSDIPCQRFASGPSEWTHLGTYIIIIIIIIISSIIVAVVYLVLMESVKESGSKLSLRTDQLMDLTSSLNFYSSSSSPQALPVKMAAVSRSSTPQHQLSELQPLSLPSADEPGTSFVIRYSLQ